MSQRTLAAEATEKIGSTVTIKGWLHKKRLLGGLTFVLVRDRSGLIQVLVEDKSELEKLRGLQVGTVLSISGEVVKDERAPAGVEIHQPHIDVGVAVTDEPPIEIDKPLSHHSENLDTLFEYRALALRNIDEQRIFRIRATVCQLLRQFLIENEFIEMQTPKIIAQATEGGAEAFQLEYFGKKAYLAQSPQFFKQMMVGVFERVFEINPAFRAEPSMTTRHLSEVTMLDVEMGFIESHDEVLDLAERMLVDLLEKIYHQHADDLKVLKAPPLKIKPRFPRYTVAEVHRLYSEQTKEDTTAEKDLLPAEERWICQYALEKEGCEAVFVRDFPIESMKFYHMVNPDNPQTALWADMLFRGLEIATVPQREHRYDRLVQQMKDKGLDPAHPGYHYYLQAFKYGLPPHGGFGFGIDRIVETIIGLSNIREATLFPRDLNRITP